MLEYLLKLVSAVYVYCTDFVINLSNLLHLSYYEVNFIFFVLLYPMLIIGLSGLWLFQKIKLKRLQRSQSS